MEVLGGGGPVVYLSCFEGQGRAIYASLSGSVGREFTLAAVSGLDWDRDLSPWDAPAIRKGGGAFSGGARDYLRLLTDEIIPRVEAGRVVPWRGAAGYSLAGLFALWTVFETDVFSHAASASGSLWYPGFSKYARSCRPPAIPRRVYLSLGDREHMTRNPALMPVRERTRELYELLSDLGTQTTLVFNPGNHFADPDKRTAAGIEWLLY